MKKFLLVTLSIIGFSKIQAMNHNEMCAKRDALQQKLVMVYTNSVKSSGISTDVTYTENDKRFHLPKCLWEIERNQAQNHPHMHLTLKNIVVDSKTGERDITITVANIK